MYLYLVQHGESRPKEEDPDRSLTENGVLQIKKVAKFITAHTDISVKRIIHSGKKRAQQTAELFAEALNPPEGVEKGKELDPNALPWGWVVNLSKIKDDIMIVGHLPHLGKLSALLLCQDEAKPVVQFHQGGVVCIFRNESGIYSIHWVIIPAIIPD